MIEKRSYERVPLHCRVAVTPWPTGTSIEAWLMDLSIGGAGLVSEWMLVPRQVVTVTFHLKDADQTEVEEHARGLITHRRYESESYRYGVEFVEPLDVTRQPQLLRKLDIA